VYWIGIGERAEKAVELSSKALSQANNVTPKGGAGVDTGQKRRIPCQKGGPAA
jgi:hypothetical protein